MTICRRCRKPLHPGSRYAIIGIGPECLRKENAESIAKFMKEMNLEIEKEDLDYAHDLNAANDVEVENRSLLFELIRKSPNVKLELEKCTKKTVFISDLSRLDNFDDQIFKKNKESERVEIFINVFSTENEDVALELSKRNSGRGNEKIRKMGLKKFKESEEGNL